MKALILIPVFLASSIFWCQGQTTMIRQNPAIATSEQYQVVTYGSDSLDRAFYILPHKQYVAVVLGVSYLHGKGDPQLLYLGPGVEVHHVIDFPDSLFSFWFAGTTTAQGDILASGYTRSPKRDMDCFFTKTDAKGEVQWTKTYGGPQREQGYKITHTSDGGFVIAGQTESWGEGNIDGMAIKINTEGETIWRTTLGDTSLNRLYSVVEIGNGDLLLSGITAGANPDETDMLLYRLDRHGKELWSKKYGSPKQDIAHSMLAQDSLHVVIAGYTAESGDSLSDPLIIVLDHDGNLVRKYIISTGEDTRLINGYVDETTGDYIGTGFTRKTLQDDWDVLLFRLSFEKNKAEVLKVPLSEQNEDAYHAMPLSNGNVLIVGSTDSTGNGDILLLEWISQ